jgi:hypothetical protein
MMPIFAAMPKDVHGCLDSTGVRYLLHRHFVQRHGWIVRGLESGGGPWNETSPATVFKNHAQEHHALFDSHLRSHGLNLHQVAVFAATLETLVHYESQERLQEAYRLLGISGIDGELSEETVSAAVRAYMLMYVQSTVFTNASEGEFQRTLNEAVELYPGWTETELFAEDVRRVVLESLHEREHRTFKTTLKVVEEIGERYGRWQDKECRDLKNMLVRLEEPGTGRVRLEDFYGSVISSDSWQFMESVPYLRQLGALDESDPQRMKVIIPNYINSPTNCVASSKFYDVCCIDECEALLGALEIGIAAPDATASQIIELVAVMPSDTIQAPRTLPSSLTSRLDDIATLHGGYVPLHGRLFAQWMHHAYPRECQYPHMSGTTKPVTQETWMEQTDEPIMVTMDEIQRLVDESKGSRRSENSGDELPWSSEEELFVCRSDLRLPEQFSPRVFARSLILAGSALASVVLVAVRSSGQKIADTGKDVYKQKIFV